MESRHKRYIDGLRKPDPKNSKAGICEMNYFASNKLLEGVVKVEFNSLYPNLFVKLYRDGTLDRFGIEIPDEKLVEKVEYFLNHRFRIRAWGEADYQNYKIWINSMYNKELRGVALDLFDIYHQYMTQYYNDIKELNRNRWLYTDIDMMYLSASSVDDIVVPRVDTSYKFPYTKTKVEFLYIERLMRYVEYSEGVDFKTKGYYSKYKPDDVISLMKSAIRNQKLTSIIGEEA